MHVQIQLRIPLDDQPGGSPPPGSNPESGPPGPVSTEDRLRSLGIDERCVVEVVAVMFLLVVRRAAVPGPQLGCVHPDVLGAENRLSEADEPVMNDEPAQRRAGERESDDAAELISPEPGAGRVVRTAVKVLGRRIDPRKVSPRRVAFPPPGR
jgi:hypothetical protein